MTTVNRFAISALSRANKSVAIPEEILIHKKTGQTLVMTPDGNVISYDSLARYKSHVDIVTMRSDTLGIIGDIFSIEVTGIEFPDIIQDAINILPAQLLLKVSPSKLYISIDMDCLEISTINTTPTQNEPRLKLDFTVTDGTTTKTFTVNDTFGKVTSQIIDAVALSTLFTLNGFSLYLTGITIIGNTSNAGKAIKNIIHSILMTIV